ncbi:hypothetical protein [Geothrix sp. 21YS21S-2]|uniref:hypothetical protein n=1 Tax=Geothrix sp. 21YS21S-2 TaxID=3068893 RepID=UPI0027B902D8|nr:hypothetical protein [Geothrix sp. 21YS21S-2]
MFKTIARWFGFSRGPVEPGPWEEPTGPIAHTGPDSVKVTVTFSDYAKALKVINDRLRDQVPLNQRRASEFVRHTLSEMRANFERDEAYKDRDLWYGKAVAAEDRLVDQGASLQIALEENRKLKEDLAEMKTGAYVEGILESARAGGRQLEHVEISRRFFQWWSIASIEPGATFPTWHQIHKVLNPKVEVPHA